MTGDIEPRVDGNETLRARRYLLDEMEPSDREAFELELLGNRALLEIVETAEEALLLDCAAGHLSPAEQERAERSFLDQSRRDEVEIIRAIQSEESLQPRRPARAAHAFRRSFVRRDLALAASMALILGSSLGWLASTRFRSGNDVQTTEIATSIERGQGGATELSLPENANWLRLVLQMPNGTAAEKAYRVEVLRAVTAIPLWVRDSLTTAEAGRTIVQCDVPKTLLSTGSFFVRVVDPATNTRLVETGFVVR